MIKIPHTLEHLDSLAQQHYLYFHKESSIREVIDDHIDGPMAPLLNYVWVNLEKIIAGRPDVLESMIPALDQHIVESKQNYRNLTPGIIEADVTTWFNDIIFSIFNYDHNATSFTKRYEKRLAYGLARTLNITTCPYCNGQFTVTFDVEDGKSRPQFDHFLYKSRYPYFAISFYNLIPSCYVCNASVKGSTVFSIKTHLHPYLEGMEGAYKFETKISSVDFLVNKKEFDLHLVAREHANPDHLTRSEGSIEAFAIIDRYQFHKDYASDIIKKAHLYTHTTIKSIIDGFNWEDNPVFSSPEDGLETLMGNFLTEEGLHKRIFSKLSKDVAEEFSVQVNNI
ncbi:hypothetical protein BCL90_3803 [Pedobacter alluvionis]|nr:hypothetical protein BCL90_3803 [Pedobacter alluvionis]